MENVQDEAFQELLKEYQRKKMAEELGLVKKKPKLAQRMLRAIFVSTPLSTLLFILLYLAMAVINNLNGSTVVAPGDAGIFGFITALSAGIGIELSKDIEE